MSAKKPCTKCGEEKFLHAFYATSKGTPAAICKECQKRAVRENRAAKRGQYSEYERARFKRPERKAQFRDYQFKRRHRDPAKESTRRKTAWAMKTGKLTRQPCEVCGDVKAQAHHEDYSKPLEVKWLCFKHHREAHGQVVVAA